MNTKRIPPLDVSVDRPRVVIDYSVLCYLNWFKMRARDYVAQSPLEIEEYARNMATHLHYLNEFLTPSEMILAIDSPANWRAPYYESYYKTACDFWRVRTEPSGWIALIDKVFFHVGKDQYTEKWFVDKMKKADADALNLTDLSVYTPFLKGDAPAWLVEKFPDAPRRIEDHPDYEGLKLVIPRYKGNRANSKWDFETPKSEWRELSRNLAYNLAPVFNARAVQVEWAEGDDIVAAFCLADPLIPTVLVSIDSDLRQLCIPCINLQYFNPKKMKFDTPTAEAARFEMLCKLLGGDDSDNIAGVSFPGKAPFSSVSFDDVGGVKTGKTTVNWVRKILGENGRNYGELYRLLETSSDTPTYWRNLNLIHLGNIPAALKKTLAAAVAWAPAEPAKYNLAEHFGVIDRVQMAVTHQAKMDRVKREGSGTFEGLGVGV